MPSGVKRRKNCCSSLNSSETRNSSTANEKEKTFIYLQQKTFFAFADDADVGEGRKVFILKNESKSGFSGIFCITLYNTESHPWRTTTAASTIFKHTPSSSFPLISILFTQCGVRRETSESSSHRMIKNTFFHPFAKWHTHHRYKLSIECGMRWNLLSLSTLAADPPWLSFFLFFLFFKTDTTFPIIFFHLFSVNCWAMWSAYTQWNSSEAPKWDEENVEIWNSTCHAIQPTNPSACVLFFFLL